MFAANNVPFDRKGRDYIIWLDLETTGSLPEDHILEIGACITDRHLVEVDAKQIVLPILPKWEEALPDVVRMMHTTNGLLEDCKALLAAGRESGDLIIKPDQMIYNEHLAAADIELAHWVRSLNGSHHMPIGGSGVSHFDRRYIIRDLPAFDKRITYKHLDIGVVRWFMELAGVQLTAQPMGGTINKTHRALDDARVHAEEARRWLLWARDR